MTLAPVVHPADVGKLVRLVVLAIPLGLVAASLPAQTADAAGTVRRRAREARRRAGTGARGAEARDRELRRQLDETRQLSLSAHNRLEELAKAAPAPTVSDAVEERLAKIEESVHQIPDVPKDVVSAGDFPGSIRIPGTDVGAQDRRPRADDRRRHPRPARHRGPVRHLLDPGGGQRGGGKGVALRADRHPQPVQPGPADADRCRGHAGLHRGRLRRLRPGVSPAPRLRPVEGPGHRPDLVHLRGPRGRAGRDRLRGPERDRALPTAPGALHAPLRRALQPGRGPREPGARHHERPGGQPGPGPRRARPLAAREKAPGAPRLHERVPQGRARERRAALPPDPRRAARPAEHDALDVRRRRRRQRPAHGSLGAQTRGRSRSRPTPAAASAATSRTSGPSVARTPSTTPPRTRSTRCPSSPGTSDTRDGGTRACARPSPTARWSWTTSTPSRATPST